MKSMTSHSEEETRKIAEGMADTAEAGAVFCLCGDLGAGKTAFAKGFAKGLGVLEDVTSPTFTIVHEYRGRLPLFHFDLYRIPDEDSLYDIGFDEYPDRGGVCLIEWADLLRGQMPENAVWIRIERGEEPSERRITVMEGAGDE